jgi:amidase
VEPTDLAFAGLAHQAELVRTGEVSSRELVELSLERIARIDPELHSFRTVFTERALVEADQAQARREAGEERPLLGVPVAIKDEVDVAGEVTTFGTGAVATAARVDSRVVSRLRSAGAIPIGMTNVPELTMWAFSENKTWGITRNPWDLERTPGGSSGGSAAAVAAALVPAALGTDGAGSIRIPAACCGLFGIKPQRGRVSYAPLDEHWYGLSAIGPLARSVRDAALLLDVIAEDGETSFVDAAQAEARPLRIALSTGTPIPVPKSKEVLGALREVAATLEGLGHHVEEADPDFGLSFLEVGARYFRGIHDDAVGLEHPHRLERRTRGMARLGGLISDRTVARARAREAATVARLGRVLETADVLLTPTIPQLPLRIGAYEGCGALRTFNGNSPYGNYTSTWNLTGQPAAAVPAGVSSAGLPLSVQLVGRPHDEATLFTLAAQLEAARPWADRRPSLAA